MGVQERQIGILAREKLKRQLRSEIEDEINAENEIKQSKKAEILITLIFGILTSMLVNLLIFPLFDISVSIQSHIILASIFTIVSIIRSLLIKRIFIE